MNIFNPDFLKRTDKFLLQNHPLVWVTRIHYVLFYAVFLFLFSFLLGWLFPVNLVNPNSLGIYYLLFILISIALYVLWVYRNSIFNIESRFGNRSIWDEYKMFFFYFITITLLATNYLPFQAVNEYRMANAISDEEFVRELNIINLADPYFISASEDYQSTYDSARQHTYYDYSEYKNWGRFTPRVYNYNFLFGRNYNENDYFASSDNRVYLPGTWTDSVISKKFAEINDPRRIRQLISDYLLICKKYDVEIKMGVEEVYGRYKYYVGLDNTLEYLAYADDNGIYSAKSGLERVYVNVVEAKIGDVYYFRTEYMVAIFYLVFYFVVFFMMFRNVRWQQYLVTLITLAILPLIIIIIVQLGRHVFGHDDAILGGIYFLIYSGVFIYSFVFAFATPKKYTAFGSILLQISNVCTPIMPMLLLVFTHSVFGAFQYYKPADLYEFDSYYLNMNDHDVYLIKNFPDKVRDVLFHRSMEEWWRACYDRWLVYSQIIGIIFYVGFYMPFIKEQFVKLKALPRKK
jgi:hypothetical protein